MLIPGISPGIDIKKISSYSSPMVTGMTLHAHHHLVRASHSFRDALSADDVVSTCVYAIETHEEDSNPGTSVIAPPMLAPNRTVSLLRAPQSTRPSAC